MQGTYKPSRHARREDGPSAAVSEADRRRVLEDLPKDGRRIAVDLLDQYGDWDAAGLHTLRLYCLSCVALTALTDPDERRKETRINLQLLKALALDGTPAAEGGTAPGAASSRWADIL
jgi:hypothetical protein